MATVSVVCLSFSSTVLKNLFEAGIQNLRQKILPMASQSGVFTGHDLTIFPGGRLRLAGGAEVVLMEPESDLFGLIWMTGCSGGGTAIYRDRR